MRRRTILLTLAAAMAATCAYACWPRAADLRGFDPAAMARLETAMWRDYYDKHYPALFYHFYQVSRTQFGFSPIKSLHISVAAAAAAKTFQPTRARHEADAALPHLVTYFRDLASAAPVDFDLAEAARLELDWWQARREKVGPRDYGVTVAHVTALTYGRSAQDEAMLRSGVARAEAMAYRDARGQGMGEQDWTEIERQLLGAYQTLKAAVAGK